MPQPILQTALQGNRSAHLIPAAMAVPSPGGVTCQQIGNQPLPAADTAAATRSNQIDIDDLMERADDHLIPLGAPGRRALQHRLLGRAPFEAPAQIVSRFLSNRAGRDRDRSVCRADARASPSHRDGLATVAPPAQPGCLPYVTRLRLGSPLQWLTGGLLLAAHGAPASAQRRSPTAATYTAVGAAPAAACTHRALLSAAGAALGTVALGGVTLWRLQGDAAPDPHASAQALQASALEAMQYLDQSRGADGERQLDRVLWCTAVGAHDTLPADALESAGLLRLSALTGGGPALAAWLDAVTELEPHCRPVDTARPGALRRHGPSSDTAVVAGELPQPAQLLQRCSRIVPAQLSLAALEIACAQVTEPTALTGIDASDLAEVGQCLRRIQSGVEAINSTLRAQRAALDAVPGLLPQVDALRQQAVDRLVLRCGGLHTQLTSAISALNQQVLDQIG